MKTMKKVLALLVAVLMIAASVSALAAGNHTITVKPIANQKGNHTYTAYQVFAGQYDETAKNLSNITWGADVDGDAILDALKADTTHFQIDDTSENAAAGDKVNAFANATSAADVAKILGANAESNSDFAKAFADVVGANLKSTNSGSGTQSDKDADAVISGLSDGYYFVKDTTATVAEGDSRTDYILYVCANVEVTTKAGTVESSKKVDDVNDSTAEEQLKKDSSDYDIGDDIPYTLTFKLPANYAAYKKYYVSFVDDMSKGLTYNGDAKIYYGENDTTGVAIGSEFVEDTTASSSYTDGKVYKYTINDLKTGTEAQQALNAGDVITIKYTAKLNASAVIGSTGNPNKYKVEYSRNPNDEGAGKPETGETPWDIVISFTYKTVFNKVDGDKKPLTGADFKLEKFIKSKDGKDTNGDDKGTWTDVTTLGDGTNHPTKATEELTNKNGSAASAKFTFSGLDDGVYRLTETTTPAGYNTIDPIVFTITAAHDLVSDNPTLTSLTGSDGAEFTMTANVTDGSLTADIENNQGSTLPSTGGIGTTIFYIAGSLLAIGAAILLITKRRMGADE